MKFLQQELKLISRIAEIIYNNSEFKLRHMTLKFTLPDKAEWKFQIQQPPALTLGLLHQTAEPSQRHELMFTSMVAHSIDK